MKTLALTVAMLCLVTGDARAQTAVDGEPTCPTCTIELTKVVTLGVADGPGEIDRVPATGMVDARGRFYVVPWHGHQELVLVYEADGTFVQQIGSVGQGPDEYRQIRALEAVGDTTYLFDARNGRLTKVGPDYRELSTQVLSGRVDDLLHFPDGSMVVNMGARDHLDSGLALHFFDPGGDLVRSTDEHAKHSGDISSHRRWLVPYGDGFWAVNDTQRYRLARYDRVGNLKTELVVDADWFQPYDGTPVGAPVPGQPTSGRIRGAWASGGLIWVLGMGSDPRWKEGIGSVRKDPGHDYEYYEVQDATKVYDVFIDAIDPESGMVVARHVIDEPTIHFAYGDGLVASTDQNDLGFFFVDIYKVSLVR